MEENFDRDMYTMVAKNIKKFREEAHMSLEELALNAEIDVNYLKRLEKLIDIKISIYDLYKISVILEVSLDKFFLK